MGSAAAVMRGAPSGACPCAQAVWDAHLQSRNRWVGTQSLGTAPTSSVPSTGEEMRSLRCEQQDGKASKERGLWHQLVDHKPGSELTTSGRVCFLIFEAFSSP